MSEAHFYSILFIELKLHFYELKSTIQKYFDENCGKYKRLCTCFDSQFWKTAPHRGSTKIMQNLCNGVLEGCFKVFK